jgi:hypothetical protein
MEKLLGLLKSRKFWATFVGMAFVVLKAYVPQFPFSEEQILAAVALVAAYVIGTGLDGGWSK